MYIRQEWIKLHLLLIDYKKRVSINENIGYVVIDVYL